MHHMILGNVALKLHGVATSLWSLTVGATLVAAATAAVDLADLMVIVLELEVGNIKPRPAAIPRQFGVATGDNPVRDIASRLAIARVRAATRPARFCTRSAHVQCVVRTRNRKVASTLAIACVWLVCLLAPIYAGLLGDAASGWVLLCVVEVQRAASRARRGLVAHPQRICVDTFAGFCAVSKTLVERVCVCGTPCAGDPL